MKLSILDQAPITKGNTAVNALKNAEELAILGDKLGYTRMWMAEHHGTVHYASSAPEISAAHLAAKTERIRIGTGGVMMMHYSPLKMAEVFKTLSAYSPDRIDYGVGRAPGGDTYAMYALADGRQPMVDNLYEKFDLTLELLQDIVPKDRLYQMTPATPEGIILPEAWLLGSTGNSAVEAGNRGVGYSYAHFFSGEMSKAVFEAYKDQFKPSAFLEKPYINVSFMVTAAETEEEAKFQARPQEIWRLLFQRGKQIMTLTPEEAMDYPLTEMDKIQIQENRKIHLIGEAKAVATKLQEKQAAYGFDEAMIVSIPHSQEQRLNTYRLLAKHLL